MKNLSVKNKLYFLILVVFVPIIVNQTFTVFNLYQKDVEAELKSNEDFAEAVSVSFSNYLQRIWDTELSMGIAISNTPSMSSEEIGQYFKSMAVKQPTIGEYSWVNPSSYIIEASSSKDAEGVSLAGREYMDRIIKGEESVLSDMVISRVLKEPTIVAAKAIRKDGVLKGIVTAAININELNLILPSPRKAEYSYFGLLDSQGVFVFRDGVPDIASMMISAKDNPDIASALKGETIRSKKYKSHVTGNMMMGVNLPVQKLGWVAYANTDFNMVRINILKDLISQVIITLGIIFIGLFVIIIISKQILEPISKLHASALEMSKGNLNARTNIRGRDEISSAAQAFDEMAVSIQEYDALKTQFFSNLSHELRTPLNIILSSIQLIEAKYFKNEACMNYNSMSKYMNMMRKNCYRLLRLISNLIDITKIDSGFLKMHFGNFNIVSIVEDITVSVADFAGSKGITIIFDTDIEEKNIACDPDKIERIMLNILSNSIKFTPKGGSIFVNMFDREDKVLITIKDTGIGIPEDKINIIFERFRQVDSSMQRECEGSGIGLSLAKALVEAHKGNIKAQSQYGQGTEVIIELPSILAAEEEFNHEISFEKHNIDRVKKINIEFSDIYY